MKHKSKLHLWMSSVLVGLALTASSYAQTQPNSDYLNQFNTTASGVDNSTASWIYWYNGGGTVSLSTNDAANNPASGSLKVTIPFTSAYRAVDQGTWFGNWDAIGAYDTIIVYNGTYFTNLEFDIKMDPSDPLSAAGDYGVIGIGLVDRGTPNGAREAGTVLIPGIASNTWVHLSVPVNRSAVYLSNPGVIGPVFTYSTWDNGGQPFLTNAVTMYIDNVRVRLGAVTNPPPTMSITKVKPGLNFVQGSISGQFDRQNIRTVNSTTGTPINYSWVGAVKPVTYSFNISQWNAPDLNFHIYITPGLGGESASDYNETNVMILQIGQQPPDGTVVSLIWKTNFPSSNGTNIAVTATNQSLLGTWKLQFTSDTAAAIIAPDSNSYPFTVDSGLVTGLANPVYISFGLNPKANTNTILGESVVISQIGIQGVGSLSSVATVTNDNFLADSQFDTNSWVVNALYAPSIWFVPTNTAYSVDWTIPDTGFSLIQSPSLLSLSTGTPVQFPVVLLTPGARELIPSSSLPAGNSRFFALIKRTPTQIQVLLPGETAAPNTPSGKTGSPTPVGAASNFNVIVNMCDASWNVVNSTDTVQLTSTGSADAGFLVLNGSELGQTAAPLAAGTFTFQCESLTGPVGTTCTATDMSNGAITAGVSSTIVY
jgi:hypothetical protein